MAKQDYIPATDGDFATWHDNFNTQVAAVGATVGLSAGEITSVETQNTDVHAKLTALSAAKANAAAKATEKQTSVRTATNAARGFANRVKNHPAYTVSLGQQLGIVGPEDTTDLTTAKPTLKAAAVLPGSVTVSFNKSVSSGIRLMSKRGAETTFSFLAVDTSSPYVDNRPNLAAGPETRQYQAQYLSGDDLIGLLSDVLNVTVPG